MEKSVPKSVKTWYNIFRTKVRLKIDYEQIVKPIDFFNRFAIIGSTERRLPKRQYKKHMKEELLEFLANLTEEEIDKIVNHLPELIALLSTEARPCPQEPPRRSA